MINKVGYLIFFASLDGVGGWGGAGRTSGGAIRCEGSLRRAGPRIFVLDLLNISARWLFATRHYERAHTPRADQWARKETGGLWTAVLLSGNEADNLETSCTNASVLSVNNWQGQGTRVSPRSVLPKLTQTRLRIYARRTKVRLGSDWIRNRTEWCRKPSFISAIITTFVKLNKICNE